MTESETRSAPQPTSFTPIAYVDTPLVSNIPSTPPPTPSKETRTNFGLLILHHIATRTGWIFKTESVIMPAVLDSIGGSAWLRGWLPTMSRLGQSIPPLVVSDHVSRYRLKKHWLMVTSVLMGVTIMGLALLWSISGTRSNWWLPIAFLALYTCFFACTGTNQVVLGTLQAKLVIVTRRGRLMLIANAFGSVVSIACAWLLLRNWFRTDSINFVAIFLTSGTFFVVAGLIAMFFKEQPDQRFSPSLKARNLLHQAWSTVKQDRQFRLLACVTGLFGMTLTLFPHYQALAMQRLDLDWSYLIPWLIAQNLGVGILSFPVGSLADRLGNLWVLRVLMVLIAAIPVVALVVTSMGDRGQQWFIIVFVMLGLTPITMRILNNYALELATAKDQPIYLSTLGLFLAAGPVMAGPLIGAIIDGLSFEWAFGIVVGLLLTGCLVTWKMIDPRERVITAT